MIDVYRHPSPRPEYRGTCGEVYFLGGRLHAVCNREFCHDTDFHGDEHPTWGSFRWALPTGSTE